MKVFAFLLLVLLQAIISSNASDGDNHLNICTDNHSIMNMTEASVDKSHYCDQCVSISFALPNETIRHFVLINQVLVELNYKHLYQSKFFKLDNPPPIYS